MARVERPNGPVAGAKRESKEAQRHPLTVFGRHVDAAMNDTCRYTPHRNCRRSGDQGHGPGYLAQGIAAEDEPGEHDHRAEQHQAETAEQARGCVDVGPPISTIDKDERGHGRHDRCERCD